MSGINLVNFNRQANYILDKIQETTGTSRGSLSERITQVEPRAVNGKIQGKKFGSSPGVGEVDARNCNMLLGCMAQMCAGNPPNFLRSGGDQSQQARALIAFLKCPQDLRNDLIKNGNFGEFLQQAADMTDEELNRSDNFKQFLQNYSHQPKTTTPLFEPLQDPALSQLNLLFETPITSTLTPLAPPPATLMPTLTPLAILPTTPPAEPFDDFVKIFQNFQSQLERRKLTVTPQMIPISNQKPTLSVAPTLKPLAPLPTTPPKAEPIELPAPISLAPLPAEPVELLAPILLAPLPATPPKAEPVELPAPQPLAPPNAQRRSIQSQTILSQSIKNPENTSSTSAIAKKTNTEIPYWEGITVNCDTLTAQDIQTTLAKTSLSEQQFNDLINNMCPNSDAKHARNFTIAFLKSIQSQPGRFESFVKGSENKPDPKKITALISKGVLASQCLTGNLVKAFGGHKPERKSTTELYQLNKLPPSLQKDEAVLRGLSNFDTLLDGAKLTDEQKSQIYNESARDLQELQQLLTPNENTERWSLKTDFDLTLMLLRKLRERHGNDTLVQKLRMPPIAIPVDDRFIQVDQLEKDLEAKMQREKNRSNPAP